MNLLVTRIVFHLIAAFLRVRPHELHYIGSISLLSPGVYTFAAAGSFQQNK